MLIADLNEIEGRTYPARRRPKNLGGGASPIQIGEFCMGFVVLEPKRWASAKDGKMVSVPP